MEAKLITVPAQTADDFGDVCKLRDGFAPTEAKYQRLRKELAVLAGAEDNTAALQVHGDRYTIEISPCKIDRTPDVYAVRKKLGLRTLLKCCTVTIKALEDWMVKPDLESVLIVSQTGGRSYVAVPIAETAQIQGT